MIDGITNTGAGITLSVGVLCFLASLFVYAKSKRGAKVGIVDYLQESDRFADFNQALDLALQAGIADTGASFGYVLLNDARDPDSLKLSAYRGSGPNSAPVQTLSSQEGISGLVFRNQQPALVHGNTFSSLIEREFHQTVSSVLAVPLRVTENKGPDGIAITRPAGVLVFATTAHSPAIASSSLSVANAYGRAISLLLTNLRHLQFTRETILSSLQEFADFLDAKDPFSAGHSRRTAEIAVRLAERMRIDPDVIEEIRAGALLLDIGKVAVPDAILQKSSSLTPDEFEKIQIHPLASYEICRKLRMPESVLLIVRSHHERLDGSGYPDGLRGGEIPVPIRIVAVADAYDAMRCARPHRLGMSAEEALQQLLIEAGTKFDPAVIEALQELTEGRELEHLYDKGGSESQLWVA